MSGSPVLDPDLALILEGVVDPEIPSLTIGDLGIVRHAGWEGRTAVITITPTYSGCPAMDAIRDDITEAMEAAGVPAVEVKTAYAPAWTTDWITERGRDRLAAAGIAPPGRLGEVDAPPAVCPQCASADTRTVSEFGSTACKALMVCSSCGEPFDKFKEL